MSISPQGSKLGAQNAEIRGVKPPGIRGQKSSHTHTRTGGFWVEKGLPVLGQPAQFRDGTSPRLL